MKLAVNSGGRHGGSAICRLWAKLPSSRLPSNVCHRVLMTARNPATLLSVKLNKANVIHDYLKVKGNGKPYLYSAFVMRCLTQRNSGMAHVNEGSYSFTCHAHVYPQVQWTIPAFIPQPQSVIALWLLLISHPTEGRQLSWPELLHCIYGRSFFVAVR